jgi:cbb3-type cytochrome oxidase subunit 3
MFRRVFVFIALLFLFFVLVLVWLFAFHCDKARKSDQSDHLNSDFFGDALGVQKLFELGSV